VTAHGTCGTPVTRPARARAAHTRHDADTVAMAHSNTGTQRNEVGTSPIRAASPSRRPLHPCSRRRTLAAAAAACTSQHRTLSRPRHIPCVTPQTPAPHACGNSPRTDSDSRHHSSTCTTGCRCATASATTTHGATVLGVRIQYVSNTLGVPLPEDTGRALPASPTNTSAGGARGARHAGGVAGGGSPGPAEPASSGPLHGGLRPVGAGGPEARRPARHPRPVEIEAADPAKHVADLTAEVQPRVHTALHRLAVDVLQPNAPSRHLGLLVPARQRWFTATA